MGVFSKIGKLLRGKPAAAQTAAGDSWQDRRARASYDAAADTYEYEDHWNRADALDADSSNSFAVRQKLMRRSRYEAGSNGFYDGILETHCNMIVGVGPTLRMLTGNRDFNQLVEKEFFRWSKSIQLRRKLWCMAHARTQDGETFAILQTNPARDGVQLDVQLIEAEQCQTPFLPANDPLYTDGIKRDQYGNIEWYDILPRHPGAALQTQLFLQPLQVSPKDVLHWHKLRRPGSHRSAPSLTSSMNTGASARRMREATLAAAETAADLNVVLTTQMNPDVAVQPIRPFDTRDVTKRMMTALPQGWDAHHFKGEHPGAQYGEFHRTLISESARPISMPVNLALCDSSTYSFASGKLDTLGYRVAIDVERQDANDMVLDPLFAVWFREWTILTGKTFVPDHQWDWPSHPVIDAVAEASAQDTKLKNGTMTLRQAFSDAGMDLEDQLTVMAEDFFGEATDETVMQMRGVLLRTTYPSEMPVAQPQPGDVSPQVKQQMAALTKQLAVLEHRFSQLDSTHSAYA